jgi:hypothetical protein
MRLTGQTHGLCTTFLSHDPAMAALYSDVGFA